MRNIFDQYSQPENRVTHALMTALQEDRKLLGLFLRELVEVKPPCRASELKVLEQQYPNDEEPSEEELERRGIPDGWIYCEAWCVFIESKVIAKFGVNQIARHRRTAAHKGFATITAVAITPKAQVTLPDTIQLEWQNVYAWLRQHALTSRWASMTAEYLEVAEAKLIVSQQFKEGTLTRFAGFPFGRDEPFSYLQGKRVLELAMDKLRQRSDLRKQLKMNPQASGRPAITGSQGDEVWDFLSLAPSGGVQKFTKYPQLSLGISAREVVALVTIPDKVNRTMRRNLVALGQDKFQQHTAEVVKNLGPLLRKHPGATPSFRGKQRRYPSQRSEPFIDAQVDFDLRTAVPRKHSAKLQPLWIEAAYEAFVDKRGSNYEMQIGVRFRYDRCELRTTKALDAVAEAWLACKPFVDLAR